MDGRVLVASGAVAAAIATFTWLHGRRARWQPSSCLPCHRAKLLPRGKPLTAGPDEVSFVSYNVLCERYATSRRFRHVFAQYLDPEYRWERLRVELAQFGADVIALQEVTIDRWIELREYMGSLGYAAIAQTRAAASGNDFMLATFYKASKLRLAWSEERSRALLAAFEVVEQGPAHGQIVWMANVHLEGSPYRPNDRVSQLKSALHRLEAHMGGPEAAELADLVVLGDFNSQHQDSPCWLLRRGRLERGHTDACCPQVPTTKESIAHPFALHEAYETAGCRPPFTRKVGPDHCVLDFLWCSRHMPVLAVMRPLQQEHREMVNKFYLPGRCHPSDHLPIGAVLKLSQGGTSGVRLAAGEASTAVAAAAAGVAAFLSPAASSGSLAETSDTSLMQ